MKEPMKIKDLAVYGIPSYLLNIWERNYSPYLLPAQEEAVKNYGVLDSHFRGNDTSKVSNEIAALSSKAPLDY